jgi:flagellar M-ring protein FliF
VVDTAGRLLFRKKGEEEGMLSASQLEYQLKIERSMRDKLESMFEEVVGAGHALARVSTELEFDQVNRTEEVYDPEGQVVRSEQLVNEESQRAGSDPEGIPGVKGSLATFSEAGDGKKGSGNSDMRNNVTRNYEITKTTRNVRESLGKVKRLSVAVMVDGTYERSVDKDGNTSLKYTARNADELKWFEKMAQNAVGFDPERGDRLEVVSMPFASSQVVETPPGALDKWQAIIERMAMPLVYLLIGVGFILFVVRPFLSLMSGRQLADQRKAIMAQVASEEPVPQEEDLTLKPLGMSDRDRMYKLAQSDPSRAADLVRRWLREKQ